MPRVKIDYIVSFSSEDPDNPASNLLEKEVSKKKWLCGKGQTMGSVVLQLQHAVQISAIHIGAHHAALVEVLVGRSEKPNEEFQVLVPSSIFLSPAECRRESGVERVRSFSGPQLAAAHAQRWDRVRLVCSQPYNKHCKYGLSFVHIYESEGPSASAPSAPSDVSRSLALDTLSSDEDEFKPGELFAEHVQKMPDSGAPTADTAAQIRRATSQALKNITDSSTRLMKTPIGKMNGGRQEQDSDRGGSTPCNSHGGRRGKLETKTDPDDPGESAEFNKKYRDKRTSNSARDKSQDNARISNGASKPTQSRDSQKLVNDDHKKRKEPDHSSFTRAEPNKNANGRNENNYRKRRRSSREEETEGEEPHRLLRGAVLALSGYQNPERAQLRRLALAMGARVLPDWGPACTHLICAFPNTPKLRAVRAGPGGAAVPAARGDWLRRCSARRRLLPWRWFATEPALRVSPPPDAASEPPDAARDAADPDCDTDEEIERVVRDRDRREAAEPAERRAARDRSGYSVDTDAGDRAADGGGLSPPPLGGALPDFYDGYTFVIDENEIDARFDVDLLRRYVRAYGGVILDRTQAADASFVLRCGARGDSARSPDWVWRCHAARALLPAD